MHWKNNNIEIRLRRVQSFLGILFVLMLLSAYSCQSSRVGQRTAYTKESAYDKCSCNSVQTDTTTICYSATGESRNEMYSKEKALNDAKSGLASLLRTEIQAKGITFKNSTDDGLDSFEEERRGGVKQDVIQILKEMTIGCENSYRTQDGTYKTYIRLEVKRKNVEQFVVSKQSVLKNI